MTKRPFTKPATTYAQQLVLLQSRGMVIDDINEAEFYLQHCNYYRLAAYWLPFEADHSTHQFQPGTSFKSVIKIYMFDRELRLLVLDCIERIEVSVRSQWAYQLGKMHGSHAHLEKRLFDRYWGNNLKKRSEEVERSDEVFIRHIKSNYNEDLPPVWAVCEVMSLGMLSRWYASLRPKQIRRLISSPYNVDEEVLKSWLQHLSMVRNTCAHHARLWNRDFAVIPKHPKHKPHQIADQFVPESRKIYNTLVVLIYFMDMIAPKHSFRTRIKNMISTKTVPVHSMGFPHNWEQREIWQDF